MRTTIEDLLLTAEAILEIPADQLMHATDLALAESALAAPYAGFGEVEFYPDDVTKAAVLASHVVRNHPLPDGNKRVGLILMLAYLEQCGLTWLSPSQDEIADVFLALAAGELTEATFQTWVGEYVTGDVLELRRDAS